MASSARLFRTHWRVEAGIDEVVAVLHDPEAFPRWWGDVYLAARIVAPGDARGIGRRVRFHSRGFLPYTLRWEGTVLEADPPHGWTLAAAGDLVGSGVWRLRQDGAITDIRYDWRVEVGKPGLRQLAPLLWPVYGANHRWAMAKGRAGLEREIVRRRALPG